MSNSIRYAVRATLATSLVVSAPMQALGETFVWRFANQSGQPVSIELYSQKRQGHVWPGDGQVWTLPGNGATYTNPINCQRHEKICYGAWLPNDETSYWGVGRNNRQVCTDCCYDCTGRQTQVIQLTVGAMPLTEPAPATLENPEYCNPIDLGNHILRSPDVSDIHGEWLDGVGTGWSLTDVTREGEFLKGTLNTSRGNPTAYNIYVIASEWECH
jgi:hypothetical protein